MSPPARIGVTRSRGHACGDATVKPIRGASLPILCASPVSDPRWGPSSSLRRAPRSGIDGKTNGAGDRLYLARGVASVIECFPQYLGGRAGQAA
jgi:hypothetical protein